MGKHVYIVVESDYDYWEIKGVFETLDEARAAAMSVRSRLRRDLLLEIWEAPLGLLVDAAMIETVEEPSA